MENMDMRFIALLVALAVHCECVNIGNGCSYKLKISRSATVEYHHFVGWRYIPKEGEKLGDMYRTEKLTAKGCLEICQQTANCIAVNHCDYRHPSCHLEGDNANIAQYTQGQTNARCILLSAGLVPGENEDDRAKQNDQWTHYNKQLSVEDYDLNQE